MPLAPTKAETEGPHILAIKVLIIGCMGVF